MTTPASTKSTVADYRSLLAAFVAHPPTYPAPADLPLEVQIASAERELTRTADEMAQLGDDATDSSVADHYGRISNHLDDLRGALAHSSTTAQQPTTTVAQGWHVGVTGASETVAAGVGSHIVARRLAEGDTAVGTVELHLESSPYGDLTITLNVPDGYSRIVHPTEDGVRITVADIGSDNCAECGEHFSNPHDPDCSVAVAEELAMLRDIAASSSSSGTRVGAA